MDIEHIDDKFRWTYHKYWKASMSDLFFIFGVELLLIGILLFVNYNLSKSVKLLSLIVLNIISLFGFYYCILKKNLDNLLNLINYLTYFLFF